MHFKRANFSKSELKVKALLKLFCSHFISMHISETKVSGGQKVELSVVLNS